MAWMYYATKNGESKRVSLSDKTQATIEREGDDEEGWSTSGLYYENDDGSCNAKIGNINPEDDVDFIC